MASRTSSAKCKHVPWNTCGTWRPQLTKPSPTGLQPWRTSSSFSAVVGRFSLLYFTVQERDGVYTDFLARWPVLLAQEVPHNFSEPCDQTRLKRRCCSRHTVRHRPSVCSTMAGASAAAVPEKGSPDLDTLLGDLLSFEGIAIVCTSRYPPHRCLHV